MKNKKRKKYLEIPSNFKGFGYNEVKIRRAMVGLKRDALKERMFYTLDEIKRSLPGGKSKSADSSLGKALALGSGTAAFLTSGKFGKIMKTVSLGIGAFKFLNNIRNKRKAKKEAKKLK